MVSIIVPVYNTDKKEIRCCIDSLITQTYQDIEILLIDDGSKQDTIAFEKEIVLHNNKVRLICQENKGVSEARNKGINEANGEYVCFVDADDYVESDMIEKMLSKAEIGCVVVCNVVHNHSTDKVLRMQSGERRYSYNDSFIQEYLKGNIGKEIAFSACNKIFELRLLKEHNIFFPKDIAIGEDMIFVLKYLSICSGIKFINEGLYHYRIHENSAMNSSKKDYLDLYCKTLGELKKLVLREATLAGWALEVLTYVFTNLYVRDMTYSDFTKYYKYFIQTPIYAVAVTAGKTGNIKKNVLKWVLKLKSKLLLYAIIKANG